MERKRLINKLLTGTWVILLLGVILLFLGDRLGGIRDILSRLRREPQNLMTTFKPRDMSDFTCDFSRPEDLSIWAAHNASLIISPLPQESERPWLRVTYYPTQAPGLLWTDETLGTMDWRKARALEFLAYNPNGWPVELKVKIKDAAGAKWQHGYKLAPGRQTPVTVPLSAIAAALSPGRITYLNLFLWEPRSEIVLYFTDFRLPSPDQKAVAPPACLEFLGLEFPAVTSPGETFPASFYFMPTRPLQGQHLLVVNLAAPNREIPLLRQAPPFPAARWQPGKLAKIGPVEINIPGNTPPGDYALVVALEHRETNARGNEFEPYANPEIEGHSVAKIRVR